jgi:integrase
VEKHIANAAIAHKRLAALTASDVESYLAGLKADLSPRTIALHHAVIRSALTKALRDKKVSRNVARDGVERQPVKSADASTMKERCWSLTEARAFLATAKERPPQVVAYFWLLLDAGLRRQEIAGLQWRHVDLDNGTIRVEQQLMPRRREDGGPLFGPTKNGKARNIPVTDETAMLLRAHRASQARLKLANRAHYSDDGLVFAREDADVVKNARLGQPLSTDRYACRELARLIKASGVRPITLHGLRHTTASLMVADGVSPRDVADRLGHSDVALTLNTYVHGSPESQINATKRLGRLLHG